MVWDAVDSLSFSNQNALRAVDVNYLIEATYYLAPNYWENAGDLAVGVGDRELGRLAHPGRTGLYLLNDQNSGGNPTRFRWGSTSQIFLQRSDFSNHLRGSNVAMSCVYIHIPIVERLRVFGRSGADYSEDERRAATDLVYSVNIHNYNDSIFSLRIDEQEEEDDVEAHGYVLLNSSLDREYRVYAVLYRREAYSSITLSSLLPNIAVSGGSTNTFSRFSHLGSESGAYRLIDYSNLLSLAPVEGSSVAGLPEISYHLQLLVIVYCEW